MTGEHKGISTLKLFEAYLRREVLTYQTMNMLIPDPERKTYVGFFWTNFKEEKLKQILQPIKEDKNSFQYHRAPSDHKSISPPTSIPSNAFVEAF